MFGNDSGDGNGDHDGFSFGQLLFGLWMWRELESGRLDAGSVFKAIFVILAVLGGGFLLLLMVVGMSMPRYDGYDPYTPMPGRPRRPPTRRRGRRPDVDAGPTASPARRNPSRSRASARRPGRQRRTVTVSKVQRWKPSWYTSPAGA